MRLLSFNNLKINAILLVAQVLILVLPTNKSAIILPNLIAMMVFFFSILQETRPNYFVLIILGIMFDAYCGFVIGITSLSYILISLVVSSNKKALSGQKFNIVWAVFAASFAISEILKSLIVMQYNYLPNILMMTATYLLNVMSYPLFHHILARKLGWFKNA